MRATDQKVLLFVFIIKLNIYKFQKVCTTVTLIEDIADIADNPLAIDGQLFQEKILVLEGEIIGTTSVQAVREK